MHRKGVADMKTNLKTALLSALPILPLCFVLASGAEARTFNLDCAALPWGLSLQELLDRGLPGDTLNLTGTCNERITINVDNITINGGGVAVIDGTGLVDNSRALVRVHGSDVKLFGLTVENSPDTGIQVRRAGSAVIRGSTIRNNARHGIGVTHSSYAHIGADAGNHDLPGFPGSQGNTIENNGGHGVNIGGSSSAHLFHNIIRNNGTVLDPAHGIQITRGGSARIDGNEITGNTNNGIRVTMFSAVRFSDHGNHGEPNLIELNAVGLRCGDLGGALDGNPQVFGVGNPGTGGTPHADDTRFDAASCVKGPNLGF
jgi:hypothetical protein